MVRHNAWRCFLLRHPSHMLLQRDKFHPSSVVLRCTSLPTKTI